MAKTSYPSMMTVKLKDYKWRIMPHTPQNNQKKALKKTHKTTTLENVNWPDGNLRKLLIILFLITHLNNAN